MYINGEMSSRSHTVVSVVDEFCYALSGKKPIHSILIANNGMAAAKFIRSIRSWAYETFGTEKAIMLVAMATPEDIKVNAEHVRIADQFVKVPGGTNNNNYANIRLIVEIAETTHVDSVWPGWGHASENSELPDALATKGIIFLGPSAASMSSLGDKIGSSLIAQAADVPTLAWSGSRVKLPPESSIHPIPEDIYARACVFTIEEAISCCQVVGYPAMIKASWGGGGKGIRKVYDDDEVKKLFKQVQREAPGSPIFIMKVASQSRHLEVQLLCDQHGNIATLHSRDCSVQRRHQKMIEEGPITVAPSETVKKLEQAARRLAKCVNYVGAATVEYLYSMETGEYYFLEINPRLQVEHPVTELLSEVNLPAAQVAIGMGIPLWQIPEIRRFYGMKHGGRCDDWRKTSLAATPFDFDKTESTRPRGHCIAVRVTSEDPDNGFKPTSGCIQELSFKSKPNLWAYFSVKSGGGIHEFSDSQFGIRLIATQAEAQPFPKRLLKLAGHIFASGESRALAIANMVLGLKEICIRGEIRTNINYTIDLLHDLYYKENKIHTDWLGSRIATRVRAERPPWYLSVVGGTLYTASTRFAAMIAEYVTYLEKGHIPPRHISLVKTEVSLNVEDNKYSISCRRGGPQSYRLMMNKSEIEAEMHPLSDGGFLIQLDGNSHVIYPDADATGTRLLVDGRTCLLQNDDDPSKLVTETSCKLVRYLVTDGSHVNADMPYAEVEVMKMCMPLLSPTSGTIHFKMSEGQVMQAGELIAKLGLDDPSAVRNAPPFLGSFPALGPPSAISREVHQRFASSVNAARMILAGYEHNVEEVAQNMLGCLYNPELAFLQWQECFAILANKLPKDLRHRLEAKCKNIQNAEFPARNLSDLIETYLNSCADQEKGAQEALLEPLMKLLKSYEGGQESHARGIVQSLFEEYLTVEELFNDNIQADVVEQLRLEYKKDLQKVVEIVLSHQGIKCKNELILLLMEQLVYPNPAAYQDKLIRFSALKNTIYSQLALKAKQLLELTKLRKIRSFIARNVSESEVFAEDCGNVNTPMRKISVNERMRTLVSAPFAIEDALVGLFDQTNRIHQRRVVETYVRTLYQPYLVEDSVRIQWHSTGLIASWEFLREIERKNWSPEHRKERPLIHKCCDTKWGCMVVIKSLDLLQTAITNAVRDIPNILRTEFPKVTMSSALQDNIMHIALVGINSTTSLLQDRGDEDQAQERINKLAKNLAEEEVSSSLRKAGVNVISCIIQQDARRGTIRHSFQWSSEKLCYTEPPLMYHLEPYLCTYLELEKLKGFDNIRYIPSHGHQWHLYAATEKTAPIRRMFLRTIVRENLSSYDDSIIYEGLDKGICTSSVTSRSILRYLFFAMEELEFQVQKAIIKPDHAHIYLHILEEQHINDLSHYNMGMHLENDSEEAKVEKILKNMACEVFSSVGVKMHHYGVYEWEVKLCISTGTGANSVWRIVVANITGGTSIAHVYREVDDTNQHKLMYHSVSDKGPLHFLPITASYPPLGALDRKRLLAKKHNTTYCYDFLMVFQEALEKAWASKYLGDDKSKFKFVLKATEFIFADASGDWGTPVVSVEREPGFNDVGMVAWTIEISTPEFRFGRTIIVIANDVTFRNGSFGPRENAFFRAVTDIACSQKLPLIYLAANSGARMGVAEEVKSCFEVGWTDGSYPEHGFEYLYLTPEDNARIGSSVIAHEKKLSGGEIQWLIDTIVGEEHGIGVENVISSAGIASAYSRAYKETFTLTYVSGRIVGIGAYLSRLGMRCIQRLDQPIILTGFSALNKLLGREVYSSHMQLGGPKIMTTNGVVHLTASDDLEGISTILKWLSFVPAQSGGPLPIVAPFDPPKRPVEYLPDKNCDPLAAICGTEDRFGNWLGGIFDKDSFVETQKNWGRTVVAGRAKLGGIPVGIIATETRRVMQVIPADPMQPDSHERVIPQAGQIWYPDSATKTAQAMMDFNREELPLFILANWRGFSGGQTDLFEGILQAGADIVENLRTYSRPVFVYIPINGELRGGASAVIFSTINPNHIEMYAECSAKASILEPEGLIEIKFRAKDMHECMFRLDQQLISLKSKLVEAKNEEDNPTNDSIKRHIEARKKKLLPLYTQIAMKFAELHDTSSKMVAKGVVRAVVEWKNSRYFFYRRLKRRLSQDSFIMTMRNAAGENLSYETASKTMKKWFLDFKLPTGEEAAWEDDESFFTWRDDHRNYEFNLQELHNQKMMHQMLKIGDSIYDLQALPQSLLAVLKKVEPLTRQKMVGDLQNVLNSLSNS